MRNFHVGFREKQKIRRGGRDPLFKRRGGGNAPIRVVDFYRVQPRCIVRKKFTAGEIFRIKRRLPARVRKSGSSTIKLSVWHVLETCKPIVPLLRPIIAGLLSGVTNQADLLDVLGGLGGPASAKLAMKPFELAPSVSL